MDGGLALVMTVGEGFGYSGIGVWLWRTHNAHARKTRRVFPADHNREVSGVSLAKRHGSVMPETLRVWSAAGGWEWMEG